MSPPTETPNDATRITCAHNRAVLQEFVYIDGAHTYEAASRDFRGADPFVLPGGYVFFDDTGEAWGPEMARVVREVQQHPHYELIARTPNYFFRKRLDAPSK